MKGQTKCSFMFLFRLENMPYETILYASITISFCLYNGSSNISVKYDWISENNWGGCY